jgi:hypothetical protein
VARRKSGRLGAHAADYFVLGGRTGSVILRPHPGYRDVAPTRMGTWIESMGAPSAATADGEVQHYAVDFAASATTDEASLYQLGLATTSTLAKFPKFECRFRDGRSWTLWALPIPVR